MAYRNIKIQDSVKVLKKCLKLKENVGIRDRIRVLILVSKGITDAKIAKQLDYSIQWVKKWIGRYKKYGFAGLSDQFRSGAPTKLSDNQIMTLYEKILSGPDEDEILSRFRISDIKNYVSDKWGIKYTVGGMHSVMKRMKLSHVTPRPQHPKNDPAIMKIWKKKRKPLLKKKGRLDQKKKFSFGIKTNPDLGKKEL